MTATLEAPPAAFPREPLSEYELERGKGLPTMNHALIQARLICAFSLSDKYEAASELSLDLGTGAPAVPDISLLPRTNIDLWNDEARATEPPVSVVEIVSPTQSSSEMVKKVHAYLAHGVQTCWLVDPPLHQITVFHADGTKKIFDEGLVTDPVTGITADLALIFA